MKKNIFFEKRHLLIDLMPPSPVSARVNKSHEKAITMFRSVGIDIVTLLTCSTELNTIELIFNVMVQRCASRLNISNTNSDADVLNLLYSVVD